MARTRRKRLARTLRKKVHTRKRGGVVTPVNQTPQSPAVPMFSSTVPQLGPLVPMIPPPPPLPAAAALPPPGRRVVPAPLPVTPSPPTPGARLVQLSPAAAQPGPMFVPAPSAPPVPSAPGAPKSKFYRMGSYGCTYKPPLACDDKSAIPPNSITKLISEKHAAEEMSAEATTVLADIDPAQDYFIYPNRSCTRRVNVVSDPDFREIAKCDPIARIDRRRSPLDATLLIMPDGGENLHEFVPPIDLYGATLLGTRSLLEGMIKLHDKGYVHMDVKPENIVGRVDGTTVKLRYIDFGLFRKHNPYKQDDIVYPFDYPWYPFELRFLSSVYPRGDVDDEWDRFLGGSIYWERESRDYNRWRGVDSNGVSVEPPPAIKTECDALYDRFKLDKPGVGSEILKKSDSYGLGRSLEHIYNRLTRHSPLTLADVTGIWYKTDRGRRVRLDGANGNATFIREGILEDVYKREVKLAEFSKLWFHMCEEMMNPSPAARMSAADALAYFDATIVPNISVFSSNLVASIIVP